MGTRTLDSSLRPGLVLAVLLALAPTARAACGNNVVESGEACDDGTQNGGANSCCATDCTLTGATPDLIVSNLLGTGQWGSSGGITAYSFGTAVCNIGTCWAKTIIDRPTHPVVGQNMFRLKDGRFEHIGQSWLKHVIGAGAEPGCSGTCIAPPNFSHLGVNCVDTYGQDSNAQQSRLGPKYEVNPSTGVFPYPFTDGSGSGPLYKRLQVHNVDLDPALNAGALYFVESQYIAPDEALAGNTFNNASYRRVTVGGAPGYFLALQDTTHRQQPAIQAWREHDPGVVETAVVAGGGLLYVSARVTSVGGGRSHYEYAVQNLNAEGAARSFSVPIPPGAVVTNVGFHDVDYHSGEPFDGTDWTVTVSGSSVTWATQTYVENPNANALRWGTLYNFRFDANAPPGGGSVLIGLFKPGFGSATSTFTLTPITCAAVEGACGNGIDEDCDGQMDCADAECCGTAACPAGELDLDGDGVEACRGDCDDADPQRFSGNPEICDGIDNDCAGGVPADELDLDGDGLIDCQTDCDSSNTEDWSTPGEVRDVRLAQGQDLTTLAWSPPLRTGSTAPRYDTLRSYLASDFVNGAECVEADGTDTLSTDAELPGSGVAVFYLVRCENDCPVGEGTLGYASDQTPRVAGHCP